MHGLPLTIRFRSRIPEWSDLHLDRGCFFLPPMRDFDG